MKNCIATYGDEIIGYNLGEKDSILFNDLMKITGNGYDAFMLYLHTRTEEFQLRKHHYELDKNGEPIIKNPNIGLRNRVEDYFVEPTPVVNFQSKPVEKTIDDVAKRYDVQEGNYFRSNIDYPKLKIEVEKLGYELVKTSVSTYYVAKDGKMIVFNTTPKVKQTVQTTQEESYYEETESAEVSWENNSKLLLEQFSTMTKEEWTDLPSIIRLQMLECI